ncbi:MAG: class II aldolase/adducin family protein [Pigmentiphaga sp.]|nr:class II aldolase/adducin family protein [Pigmentiphaga sp.]
MSSSVPFASAKQQAIVRLAARALGRANLAHAYGHCSLRLDADYFLVCAPRPMGLLTEQDVGTVVPVRGPLPEGVLGEVRIHQEIYQRRPDVRGVIRSMPRDVMTLSSASRVPQARHGMGCYFHQGVALWDDVQLIRSQEQAVGVAEALGPRAAIAMRGNGAVVAAESLQQALVLTWYLEDAARIELDMLRAGLSQTPVIGEEAARSRATNSGRIFERMWEYLCHADPEFNDSFLDFES